MTSVTDIYRSARDQILAWRGKYDQAVREFRWPDVGPEFCWAIDWFDAIAKGNERPALILVEEDGARAEYSFDQIARRSDQVAAWLREQGVAKGDSVILMLGNQVELWESMLAVMKLGAVIMPTTSAVGADDLEDRMQRGRAKHVICNPADVEKFAHLDGSYTRITAGAADGWADLRDAYDIADPVIEHPRTASDSRLLLYFTSGTTSRPKLVEHTQISYPVGHLSTTYWLGLQPGDVHLNISSPGWGKHAWSCFFAPWIAEATIFVYNYTRFDAAALMQQIEKEKVTTFCAPPTVWRMLINADLSAGPWNLRECIGAGEPLNPEVIERVQQAWGITLRDGYGQTETTASIGNVPGAKVKPGSMGQVLPGVPVVLVDPLTNEPVKGEGEICIDLMKHPLSLMTGYQDDPEKNAKAMEGGFYHSGDVATVDEEGYITFIGRTDDVFKASDYKVSPFELESVLIEHAAVAEAAVVPAPDPVRLAVPKAYISLAPGYEGDADTARSILKHARERLAAFQRVRRIEFYELPKTISGKIRRVELRQRESDIEGAKPSGEWRDDDFPDIKG
ncbi:AMP-binding protein [Blastococcus sp. Marseille-P5729]|uniref:AMP-binding protein n=1 Tax=Blastococcus sp. Marseille-P5729 TaxID=2086582 RepID=UPI000D1095EF|nr:AMP-binding protein [Blastococcus sp. Marseille-P5729]